MGRAQPEILPTDESMLWRQCYLEAFVDTGCEHYQQYIAKPRQFSDGVHYEGYLWDCLRLPTRITYRQFRDELATYRDVLVMADDHSRDRVIGPPLWPFAAYSVARFPFVARRMVEIATARHLRLRYFSFLDARLNT